MKTTTLNKPTTNEPTFTKRSAQERGQSELGWLHSRHTFSFGNYFDPDHVGFRSLRVINDDVVEAGQGFAAAEVCRSDCQKQRRCRAWNESRVLLHGP